MDPLDEAAARIGRLAERDPGREVCGLVLRRGAASLEVLELPNRAADPCTGYAMAPAELLRAVAGAERDGGGLAAVFHSHPEGGARLSIEDLRAALHEGEPLWPGVEQVVVSVRGGVAAEIARYRFERGAFRRVPAAGGSRRREAPRGPVVWP